MTYYRCKCGKTAMFSRAAPAACLTCKHCGSDLAFGAEAELHADAPPPHEYVTRYNEFTGAPYERCARCGQMRTEIEAPPEPELPAGGGGGRDPDPYLQILKPTHGYPHCDQYVLHVKGSCEYCDMPKYKALHAYRDRNGINHTGEGDPAKKPCPAEARRPETLINRWGGNRPRPRKK